MTSGQNSIVPKFGEGVTEGPKSQGIPYPKISFLGHLGGKIWGFSPFLALKEGRSSHVSPTEEISTFQTHCPYIQSINFFYVSSYFLFAFHRITSLQIELEVVVCRLGVLHALFGGLNFSAALHTFTTPKKLFFDSINMKKKIHLSSVPRREGFGGYSLPLRMKKLKVLLHLHRI